MLALLCNCEYKMGMLRAAKSPAIARVHPARADWARADRWELYRLLAEPTRLRVLALAATEELAVSELAELLREGQPKVSRHASALRDAGLLHGRKHGTWLLLRLAPEAGADPVIADAVSAGAALCEADGTLERIAEVVAARDAATREFFARGGRAARSGPPPELAAYLRALAPLIEPRALAVDAGTGDGALLEVLAPVFEQVIALDRSAEQLALARQRAAARRFRNVRFVCGDLDGPEIHKAITSRGASGADAVFAARVLHHASVPAKALGALGALARAPGRAAGGWVFLVDYELHKDDAMREQQADLWPGFDGDALERMALEAGLCEITRGRLPRSWCGEGPDRHVGWQWLAGRRSATVSARR
jgi:DNA-binding transcriptional ArsR family regulator